MAVITKEEILKLAFLSRIKIDDDEIDSIVKQLQDVLSYAQRVKEVSSDVKEQSNKHFNIMREDIAIKTESSILLEQAPQEEDDFFVVPKILDNK